jgi:hypothetical protein
MDKEKVNPKALDGVQNVLNRMKKASDSNKGIRISAEELQSMRLTIFGEMWEEPDPRKENNEI